MANSKRRKTLRSNAFNLAGDWPIWDKRFVIFEIQNFVAGEKSTSKRKIVFQSATLFPGKHPTSRKRSAIGYVVVVFRSFLVLFER